MDPNRGDHNLHWREGPAPLTLHLLPEKALYWPDQATLFIADVHLGKAAVFRARGLPVPRGTTAAMLERLSHVLRRTQARHLVVLGDFLHARESHAPGTMAVLAAWRAAHADVRCTIVQGNHDRHAGPLTAEMGFELSHAPHRGPGLVGVHEAHDAAPLLPEDISKRPLVLAGHVHPVVTLRDRFDQLRLPCFALQGHVLTLPAFGTFTGGFEVARDEARLFAVTDAVTPL